MDSESLVPSPDEMGCLRWEGLPVPFTFLVNPFKHSRVKNKVKFKNKRRMNVIYVKKDI